MLALKPSPQISVICCCPLWVWHFECWHFPCHFVTKPSNRKIRNVQFSNTKKCLFQLRNSSILKKGKCFIFKCVKCLFFQIRECAMFKNNKFIASKYESFAVFKCKTCALYVFSNINATVLYLYIMISYWVANTTILQNKLFRLLYSH